MKMIEKTIKENNSTDISGDKRGKLPKTWHKCLNFRHADNTYTLNQKLRRKSLQRFCATDYQIPARRPYQESTNKKEICHIADLIFPAN